MHSLQPGTAIANINEKDAADSPAQKNLADFGKLLALHAHELGVAEYLAEMFRADPLSAEKAYQEMILGIARSGLTEAFEMLDDQGQSLEIDGTTYRKAETTPGRAMTTFGPVTFGRSRYRPSGGGAALVPAESLLGADRWWTDACGGGPFNVPDEQSDSPARARTSGRGCAGEGPSVASLVRLSGEAGNCMDECSDELLAELRAQEDLPDAAVSVLASLDGVMVHMKAETADGKTTEAGWREASCGVVALVDNEGNMLESRGTSDVFQRLARRTSSRS